jgi:hypothetical protein
VSARYSPAACTGIDVKVVVKVVSGNPDLSKVSTSYVERQNLTMRMGMRRFTRLTNGFSKKIENLAHAVSLHYMHYNFARPHKTLTKAANGYPTTPAMAAGVSDHVWDVGRDRGPVGLESLVAVDPLGRPHVMVIVPPDDRELVVIQQAPQAAGASDPQAVDVVHVIGELVLSTLAGLGIGASPATSSRFSRSGISSDRVMPSISAMAVRSTKCSSCVIVVRHQGEPMSTLSYRKRSCLRYELVVSGDATARFCGLTALLAARRGPLAPR